MYSCISFPLAGTKYSGLPVPIMLNSATSRECLGQIFVKSEACINEVFGDTLRHCEFTIAEEVQVCMFFNLDN